MSESASASAPIDLAEVRRLFSRTERVAGADFLRREIAARMHERLALVKPRAAARARRRLRRRRRPRPAEGALSAGAAARHRRLRRAAGARGGSADRRPEGLLSRLAPRGNGPLLACADFASLPLAAGALDLVWSSLALHWHPQPDRVFAEWRRALRVQGLLMFSCFGPDTLRELRGAFAAAGLAPPVLPFVDMHDFGDMLVGAGFATPVMDMETITVTYGSAEKLLADVRALGGNPLATRAAA
jgi:malonyl-CoA O-methyltransferase